MITKLSALTNNSDDVMTSHFLTAVGFLVGAIVGTLVGA
jgi:hypothetical protein